MTYITDELVAIVDYLIENYNSIVYERGGSDYEARRLTKLLADAEIGTVSFDDEWVATIKYRTYITRADV